MKKPPLQTTRNQLTAASVFVAALFSASGAFAQLPLDLAELSKQTVSKHPLVLQATAQSSLGAIATERQRAAWRPTSSLTATTSVENKGDGSDSATGTRLQGTLTLLDSARTPLLDAAKAQEAAQNQLLTSTKETVLLTLLKQWTTFEAAYADAASLARQSEAAKVLLETAQARYKHGLVTKIDVLQAKALSQQASYRSNAGKQALALAWRGVGEATGQPHNWAPYSASAAADFLATALPLKEQVNAKVTDTTVTAQNVLSLVVKSNAQQAARSQLMAAQRSVDAAQNSFRPTVYAQAFRQDNYRSSTHSHNTGASLNLTVPLGTAGLKDIQVATALKAQESLEAATTWSLQQHEATGNRLQTSIPLANEALGTAVAGKLVSSEAFELAMGRYGAGTGSLVETVQAYSALADSEITANNAVQKLLHLKLEWLHLEQRLSSIIP